MKRRETEGIFWEKVEEGKWTGEGYGEGKLINDGEGVVGSKKGKRYR